MNDLISRSALLAEYDRQHEGPPGRARKLIEDAPAIDAAEVVRCKDCVHRELKVFNTRFCNVWQDYNGMGDDGYCGYGERKENETD